MSPCVQQLNEDGRLDGLSTVEIEKLRSGEPFSA